MLRHLTNFLCRTVRTALPPVLSIEGVALQSKPIRHCVPYFFCAARASGAVCPGLHTRLSFGVSQEREGQALREQLTASAGKFDSEKQNPGKGQARLKNINNQNQTKATVRQFISILVVACGVLGTYGAFKYLEQCLRQQALERRYGRDLFPDFPDYFVETCSWEGKDDFDKISGQQTEKGQKPQNLLYQPKKSVENYQESNSWKWLWGQVKMVAICGSQSIWPYNNH